MSFDILISLKNLFDEVSFDVLTMSKESFRRSVIGRSDQFKESFRLSAIRRSDTFSSSVWLFRTTFSCFVFHHEKAAKLKSNKKTTINFSHLVLLLLLWFLWKRTWTKTTKICFFTFRTSRKWSTYLKVS
jgi:hypothetical protein